MKFSHSRVETYGTCPFKYKLRYLDKLEVLPRTDDPTNALTLGTALHTGLEQGVREGLRSYFESFPILDDLQINEAMKLAYLIPKVSIPEGAIFEEKIETDDFIGFIDMLVPVSEDGMFKTFDLFDFKYSNNIERYLESDQLHLYKYFYEATHPYHKIRNLAFIFVPKTQIRQKKTEDIYQFRKRLMDTLETLEIKTVSVDYNPNKVIDYLLKTKKVLEATEFPKNECRLCDFCDYKQYCKEGIDYMILPSTTRRTINPANRKRIWIYGAPFSGKTTFADQFPTPIMLNTDGNTNSFTAPCVEIKETYEGRQKIGAWENFKAAIDELQKGSEFKTIVVDLVEDTYEHCRLYCYDKLGIEHESDNSFKAWDYVRTEFLSTMKRLMTLDYNIVLISHEDTSKDITKRTGDKITAIKPNIQEKTALKLAGMVDLVIRIVKDDDRYTMQFKGSDVVFGGGRLKIPHTVEPLTYEALEKIYESQAPKKVVEIKASEEIKVTEEVKPVEEVEDKPVAVVEETRKRRGRPRKVEAEETPKVEEEKVEEVEETPKAVTFDDMAAVVKSSFAKYGKEELTYKIIEKFKIKKFNELNPERYGDVIEFVKAYEAEKELL